MSLQAQQFYANGKVLLSGEYFVLDGALALALPTRLGQSMEVAPSAEPGLLQWQSFDEKNSLWFEGSFELPELNCRQTNDETTARRLADILQDAARQRPQLRDPATGWAVTTRLGFPRDWGLGSSSTLIALIAQWTQTDPFALLKASFGGSGYDLACALSRGPLLYQRLRGTPQYIEFPFSPSFRSQLYFVYLESKQNSREGIARFREKVIRNPQLIGQVSRLSADIIRAADLDTFEAVIHRHEDLVAATLDLPRAQDLHFPGFRGAVKSLGAWGGDFVLLSSRQPETELRAELKERGFSTMLPYDQLIVPPPVY